MTETGIERIRAIIAPVLGKRAWGVALGYSTFITLEFGESQDVHGHVQGTWHIWVKGADWRLEDGERVITGSSDEREKQANAVKRLDGLVLQSIEVVLPAFDTTFTFEGDAVLRLFCSTTDYEHWHLYAPDGNVLTLGPGNSWSYHPGSEVRN